MSNGKLLCCFWLLAILALPDKGYGQVVSLTQPSANTILCEFLLPQYSIIDTVLPMEYGVNTTFKYVRMTDPASSVYDSVGCPELPFLTYGFEIPYSAYDCEIEMTDVEYNTFNIDGLILPSQFDTIMGDMMTSLPFSMNMGCYSSDNYFILEKCMISDSFIIRGKKGVRVAIMPFKYNPYRNLLEVIVSAKIKIHYNLEEGGLEYVASAVWDNVYKALFINHNTDRQQSVVENYLIITLPEYKDALRPFVDYKHSLGYNVNMVSLEQEDRRTPEEIKQIIQDQYDNLLTRPDYVLLVGEHPKLPAFSGDSLCGDDQQINRPITDVDYVFLEGHDFHFDAFVGRWPVREVKDVQVMANKTIFMEMNMHMWDKKAVFVAGWDERPYMINKFKSGLEYVRENTFTPLGYICSQLNQPDENTAQEKLNEDPLFYIYSGHGDCYYWCRVDDSSVFNVGHFFILNSTHQISPMVFSFACQTGNFACFGVSIAEEWMRQSNGGVIYVGSSVKTAPVSDNRIEKYVFGKAFTEEETIGGIMAVGMKRYYDSYFKLPFRGSRYVRSYNLMGDPSFRVRGLECVPDYYVEQLGLYSGDVQYYRASESVTLSNTVSVGNGSELTVRAGNEIVFRDGFIASVGAEVSARIEECNGQQRQEELMGEPSNKRVNRFELIPIENDSMCQVTVYPNPTQSDVMLEVTSRVLYGKMSILVTDIFGRHVLEFEEYMRAGVYQKSLDMSSLPTGYSYAVVTSGECKEVKCIIKQ